MTTVTQTNEQPQPVSLQVSDLKTVLNLIEVVNQRGAFKAEELVAVGTLFNRIKDFVAATETPVEESGAAEVSTEETKTEEPTAE